MREITAKEAKELVDAGGVRIVDVRERNEWDEIRVPGSELVPLSGYEVEPGQLRPAPNTIFLCAKGIRSQAAAAIYESTWQGEEALSVKGGIAAWAARAFPVDIGPPADS